MLVWKPGVPCNGVAYYLTSGPWTIAKSSVKGVWQYVAWMRGKRYPETGHGYASADEAKAVANNEDTK